MGQAGDLGQPRDGIVASRTGAERHPGQKGAQQRRRQNGCYEKASAPESPGVDEGCGNGNRSFPLRRVGQRLLNLDSRVGDVVNALSRVLAQAASEEGENSWRRRGRKSLPVGLPLQDPRDRVGNGLAAEGLPARDHLVKDAAQRPDVGPLVHRLAPGLLGAHVGGGAQDHAVACSAAGEGRREGQALRNRFLSEGLREAEIQELDLVLCGNLDVGGLEIPVDDSLLVGRLQRLGDLAGDVERLADGREPRASRSSKVSPGISSRTRNRTPSNSSRP